MSDQDTSQAGPAPGADDRQLFWDQTTSASRIAARKLRDLSQHISDLHERVQVLHERDEDYAIRLHNECFINAEIRSDRDGLKKELDRERERRSSDRVQYTIALDRIRADRDHQTQALKAAEKEIHQLKASDPESVEGIWAAYARPTKIKMLPQKENRASEELSKGKKRKMRDDDGDNDTEVIAISSPSMKSGADPDGRSTRQRSALTSTTVINQASHAPESSRILAFETLPAR